MHIHPKFMVKYNRNYVLSFELALWISVQLTKLLQELERSYQQHLRKSVVAIRTATGNMSKGTLSFAWKTYNSENEMKSPEKSMAMRERKKK